MFHRVLYSPRPRSIIDSHLIRVREIGPNMRLTFFSALTFLQYLFEGFLIVAFVDLFYNNSNLMLHLGGSAASGDAFYLAEFLAVVVFIIVGHANSTVAHMFLQELLASSKYFRPSYFFLNLVGKTDDEVKNFKKNRFMKVMYPFMKYVWKPFGKLDGENIRAWLTVNNIDPARNDRDVFSLGFGRLMNRDENENFKELLLNFSFARNMFCTLLIIGLLFIFGHAFGTAGEQIQRVATQLNLVDCNILAESNRILNEIKENGRVLRECERKIYEGRAVIGIWWFCTLFLSVRFVYFFGVVSKNAIRAAVEPASSREAAQQGNLTSSL